jgi:phosphomevalonate kinase
MTARRALFAPGKLFVIGEWAILEGAPALVACVPAGQDGELCEQVPAENHVFSFSSKGYQPRGWTWEGGRWQEVLREEGPAFTGAIDVVGEVVRAASEGLPEPQFGALLNVRPRGLFEGGQKLGFGSSGAIAALTARALAEMGGGASLEAVFRVAFEGHRAAQQGRGSGADVAVSVYGQSVRVELPEPPGLGAWSPGAEGPRATPLPPFDGLSITAVWSGKAADTRQLMTGVARFKADAPKDYRSRMASVAKAARGGDAAWHSHDLQGFLAAARTSQAALGALGKAAGVAIAVEAYDAVARAVSSIAPGAVVKLSGAGGGDMALVLAPSNDGGAVLVGHLRGLGYRCFEVM